MASAAATASSPSSRSFAGLLEEYAAPAAKFPPARDFDGLEDDVATLTYEHALRARARYRREADADSSASPPVAGTAMRGTEQESAAEELRPAQSSPSPTARKSASITVRFTAAENSRLRARATEAGLTLSEYLRSCAFEVENLRAQVKEAVAAMREPAQSSPTPRRSWLARILSRNPGRV